MTTHRFRRSYLIRRTDTISIELLDGQDPEETAASDGFDSELVALGTVESTEDQYLVEGTDELCIEVVDPITRDAVVIPFRKREDKQ